MCLVMVLAVSGMLGGCLVPAGGLLTAIQPVSDKPHQGNVYIMRGLLGCFSRGMDGLQEELDASGVRAVIYQHTQNDDVARAIIERYRQAPREPLVLVGHSLGADDTVAIAQQVRAAGVKVDLIVAVDPVNADPVPGNVSRAVGFYRSVPVVGLIPVLRGIPLKPEPGTTGQVTNYNLNDHPELRETLTNHFNIDANKKVRQAIIREVMEVCPVRSGYAQKLRPPPGEHASAAMKLAP